MSDARALHWLPVARRRLSLAEPTPCDACAGTGRRRILGSSGPCRVCLGRGRLRDVARPLEGLSGEGLDGVPPDWMLAPPWRDVVVDRGLDDAWLPVREPRVILGPEYGPTTEAGYVRELESYRERPGGDAFWDREEASMQAEAQPRAPTARQQQDRYDADDMAVFVTRRSARGDLPLGELRVWILYWREGLSVGEVARRLGRARTSVDTWIRRLRKRLRDARTEAARR